MAFSNPGYSESLQEAINYAWDSGLVVVAAAGNDSSAAPHYPAGHAKVVGVASTDSTDTLASNSNHGIAVFLSAPGVGIIAADDDGGTTTISGTSAAAAHVAGAAALLRAYDPSASNATIVGRLAHNADPATPADATGNGRLNLARALEDATTAGLTPVGAPGGGPFVGPYVVAAKSVNFNPPTASVNEGNLGTTTVSFTVATNGSGTGTVAYATSSGGATPATGGASCLPGVDYVTQNGLLTFTAGGGGNEGKTINVTICSDTVSEPNETFLVTLSSPSPSGGSGMNLGTSIVATGTITNDDAANTAPSVAFISSPATANEGETKTYTLNITDPDVGNTFTFLAGFPDCGTGGSLVALSASINSAAKTGTFQCLFPDGLESPTVRVQIEDNAGADSNMASQSVTVANLAPTVTLTGDATTNEGQTKVYSYTTNDPGVDSFALLTANPTCGANATLSGALFTAATGAGSFSCTFGDGPNSSTVSVQLEDSDGADSNVSSIVVTIANLDPTISDTSNNGPIDEGGSATITVTATDPAGLNDPLSYEFDCDGNLTYEVGPQAGNTTSCALGDNGSFTVNVRVTDGDGGEDTSSTTVIVNNLDPTISDTSNNGPIDEGSSATITVTATDPAGAADPLSYQFDCDNDAIYEIGPQPGNTTSCNFGDNGSFMVNVRVTDGDGGEDTSSTTVTVNNVDPTISDTSNNGPIDEGSSATITVTATDPAGAADPLSYEFDCDGNLTYEVGPQAGNTTSCSFANDGSFTVNVRVTDGDGGADTDSTTVTVNNVAPVVDAVADDTIDEGDSFTGGGSFTDAGADTWTATVDYGEGAGPQPLTLNLDKTFLLSNIYEQDDVYTVTVKVNDDDTFGTDTLTVTVNNVAPVVDAVADDTIDEGDSFTGGGSFTDAGADTWTATVDYGEGAGPQPLTLNADKTVSLSNVYKQDGVYTVTVTVSDDDTSGNDTLTVTVNNVGPVVSGGADDTINEGATFTGGGSFTDPGADIWTAMVDYGEGAGPQALTLNPDKTFSLSNVYEQDSVYTITVTVNDDDTSGNDTLTVTVNNVAPVVSAFTCSPNPVSEGTSTTCTVDFTDAGTLDTHTCALDWDDGAADSAVSCVTGASFNHSYTDDDGSPFTAKVTVNDDDTGTDETTEVTVTNVAPVVSSFTCTPKPVDEGTSTSCTVNFTDVGTEDTHTCAVDWGDGATAAAVACETGDSFSHTYVDDDGGPFTATVTVEDDDNGEHTGSDSVAVSNVAPVYTAPTNQSSNEGENKAFNVGSFTDVGANDDPWDVSVDWGDGSTNDTFSVNSQGFLGNRSHTYVDNDTHAVTVTVTDKDGDSHNATFDVAVSNVDPTVVAGGDQTAEIGDLVTMNPSFTDPGINDNPWAVTIDWGDGSSLVSFNVATQAIPAQTHTYAAIGVYIVEVCVTDKDLGEGCDTLSVDINFPFDGFFSPVDNMPKVNQVKAGSAIPIKFSLGGDYGMSIFAAGYPKSYGVPAGLCSAAPGNINLITEADLLDAGVGTVNPGGSSLSYSGGNQQYNYVWKTEKSWSKCRLFIIEFADGTTQGALFNFK